MSQIVTIGGCKLCFGDCRDSMRGMPPDFVSSIVTDPPYGLEFMGAGWDRGVPNAEFWSAALRVAKPGAHLLAFGGTRMFHRLMCEIEDAGWEIRDTLMWVYGSGFPKSLDISKAIDKAAGAERVVVGKRTNGNKGGGAKTFDDDSYEWKAEFDVTVPATELAKKWDGWGTCLKPAWEPIVLARRPLVGTVAENVQQFGVGGLNIDGCRVPAGSDYSELDVTQGGGRQSGFGTGRSEFSPGDGRFPANLIHDGSDEVLTLFPNSVDGVAVQRNGGGQKIGVRCFSGSTGIVRPDVGFGGSGSAARFFYCAKASSEERGTGNNHPTVKPLELMRYLVKLVTPPDGICLDMFCGSGTTVVAARQLGYRAIGLEKEKAYFDIAENRLKLAHDRGVLDSGLW